MMIVTTKNGMLYDIHSGVLITKTGTSVPRVFDDKCLLCLLPDVPLSRGICFGCIVKSEILENTVNAMIEIKKLSYLQDEMNPTQGVLYDHINDALRYNRASDGVVADEVVDMTPKKWAQLQLRLNEQARESNKKRRNPPGTDPRSK